MADRYYEGERSRPRNRDKRTPTFQVLDKIMSHYPQETGKGRKREVQPQVHNYKGDRGSQTGNNVSDLRKPQALLNQDYDNGNKRSCRDSYGHCYNMHISGTSTESMSAVSSASGFSSKCRSPACNFAHQLHYLTSSSDVNKMRSKSFSPRARIRYRQPRTRFLEDEEEEEEPSDVVVWNASKKTSRSNMLCPLTDSEMSYTIHKDGTYTKQKAWPDSQHNNIFETNGEEEEELLEDSAPPILEKEDSSVSIASTTYTFQIAKVTQQLETIQQAQNDILSQLSESMALVSTENERLKKEIELVRNQNEGLLKVVHDTTAELEWLKQLIKTHGITQDISTRVNKKDGHVAEWEQESHAPEKSPTKVRSPVASSPPRVSNENIPDLAEVSHRHSRRRNRSRDSEVSNVSNYSSTSSRQSKKATDSSDHLRSPKKSGSREDIKSWEVSQTKIKRNERLDASSTQPDCFTDEDNKGNNFTDSHRTSKRRQHEEARACSGAGDVLEKREKRRNRSRERHRSEVTRRSANNYPNCDDQRTSGRRSRSRSSSKEVKRPVARTPTRSTESSTKSSTCFKLCACCASHPTYCHEFDDEIIVELEERQPI